MLLFLSTVCIHVRLNALCRKLSYLGLSPGRKEERGKKYTTDVGHSIFVLLDDAEMLLRAAQYWAHKMWYNVQVSEWV